MRFYKIVFPAVILFILCSCSKVINVKETDSLAGDVALKTVKNNEQAIIGAYSGMNVEMGILFNGVMTDELKKSEFYNAATVHEWQFSTQDVTIRDQFTAFPLYYRIVDRVNRVLKALPTADSTGAGDNALRLKLRGEALFLRAFCHFELSRYYCGNYDPNGLGMAYMEEPSLQAYARITDGPYFQKINADLAEAKTLLPNDLTDVFRANVAAATGLQARVALYMKDWQNAVSYSTAYIATLPLATRANFPGIWKDSSNLESAFKLKRTAQLGGRIGSNWRATSASATAIGVVTWAPSDELWNSFDKTNDIRFFSYLKDEPILITAGRPSHLVAKYAGTGYGTANENVNDAKVLRTAEMYLIRAEAKAETNDLTGSAADINALRTARISGYNPVTFASKQEAIDAIVLERFKELAFEGHRLWDLKRKGLPVDRLPTDAPVAAASTLPAGNFRFTLPIPFSELQANPIIQQNPGYQ